MRRTALVSTAILAASLLLTACGTEDTSGDSVSDEPTSSQTDAMPDDAVPDEEMTDDATPDEETPDDEMTAEVRSGVFEGLGDKSVTGSVDVSAAEIVLSEFSSDDAPDLHVYLANGSGLADVEAGVEIDAIDVNGTTQTFALDGVDVADYDTVVIHCVKAKAVYGAASLA